MSSCIECLHPFPYHRHTQFARLAVATLRRETPQVQLKFSSSMRLILRKRGKMEQGRRALEFGSSANESLLRSLAFSNIGDWAQGCETITKSEIA